MARSPKPTLDDIDAWRKELKQFWQGAEDKAQLSYDSYHNEHEVNPPNPGSKDLIAQPYEMRSGRYAELCDHVIGNLDVDPNYSTDAPGKRAEEAEKWANLIRSTIEREQGEDTNSRMTGESVIIGFSGVKVFPHPKIWKGKYPKQGIDAEGKPLRGEADKAYNQRLKEFGQTAPIPIAVWHIPGRTWKPLLDGRKVIKSLECKEVTRAYVQSRYGDKLDTDQKDLLKGLNKGIEFVEYVDDRWCGYYVFGPGKSEFKVELRAWEHRMPTPEGEAPVVLVEGYTTSDSNPKYRWKGLAADVRDSIIAQDLALSQQLTAMITFWWLTIIHRIKPDAQGNFDLEKMRKTRKFTLGGTNFVMPNEELEVMAAPANLPPLESLYAKLEERIQRAVPPILSGAVEGTSSGYEFNIARQTALTRIKPLAQRLAQADADIMRMIFYALGGLSKILKKDKLTVYVREATQDGVKPIGMSWEQVRDLVPLIRATREEAMPEDLHSKIDAAIKAWKELQLPWAHVIEEIYGAPNPEELKELRDIENIVDAPAILQRTEQDVFKEMELILNDTEGVAPEEAAAGPPMPPGLEQALGMGPPVPQGGMIGPNDPMLAQAAAMNGGAPPGPPPQVPVPAAGVSPNGGGAAPNVFRTNPRAGTSSRNRGRRRKAPPPNTKGSSR
jgi:hypothetical protein